MKLQQLQTFVKNHTCKQTLFEPKQPIQLDQVKRDKSKEDDVQQQQITMVAFAWRVIGGDVVGKLPARMVLSRALPSVAPTLSCRNLIKGIRQSSLSLLKTISNSVKFRFQRNNN
jgi:hypothetical protein